VKEVQMTAPKIWLIVLAVLVAAPTQIRAQDPPPIDPGARVRVSTSSAADERIVGTLAALQSEALVVDVEGHSEPVTLPVASVTRLEVSTGRKSKTATGAGIGFGIGAAAGTVLALMFCSDPDNACGAGSFLGGSVLLGLPGAGVGALIGSGIKVERWETVPLDRIRVGLTSQPGRPLALSVTLTF
jgi:hypothetical protein